MTDTRTDRWTDRQTDARQSDPYVPLCFAGNTIKQYKTTNHTNHIEHAVTVNLSQ